MSDGAFVSTFIVAARALTCAADRWRRCSIAEFLQKAFAKYLENPMLLVV
jgi:hypothetical protein